MGTLGGFPNPPAMSSARLSRASLDAIDGLHWVRDPGAVPKPSRDELYPG